MTSPRNLTIALAVVAVLLLANAILVNRQDGVPAGSDPVRRDGPTGAPVIVLIHGLAGSAAWWDRLVPELATTHRVLRVDLLGHGRAAKPSDGDYTIPGQARRLAVLLDRLGVRDATVAGHSTGGYVATALAEQRSDLVGALALIDTGPRLDAFVSDGPVGDLILLPGVGQLLWRARTDGLLRRGLSTAFAPGFPVPPELVDDVRGMTYRSLTATSRASEDYLERSPLPDRLAALGKPLLVLFGDRDQRWRPASASLYHEVPDARVELLPGVGHSPMIEAPARTAGLLRAFTPAR